MDFTNNCYVPEDKGDTSQQCESQNYFDNLCFNIIPFLRIVKTAFELSRFETIV